MNLIAAKSAVVQWLRAVGIHRGSNLKLRMPLWRLTIRRFDMTKEEQFEAAHILKERISLEIHEIVEEALSLEKAVEDAMASWSSAKFAWNDLRDNTVLEDKLQAARMALTAYDAKKFIEQVLNGKNT